MSFETQTQSSGPSTHSCCGSEGSISEEKNMCLTESTIPETPWSSKEESLTANPSNVVPYPNELLQPVIPRVAKHRALEVMKNLAYDEVVRDYPVTRNNSGKSRRPRPSYQRKQVRGRKSSKYVEWEKQIANFFVRDSCLADAGKGLYTTLAFKQGDLMFAEKPLLSLNIKEETYREMEPSATLHEEICDCHADMSETEKDAFKSLVPDANEEMYATKTLLSSLIPCREIEGGNKYFRTMLLSKGSHINHSCTPSVQVAYNQEENLALFFATREIKSNEELSIAYVHPWQDSSERKRILPFKCKCQTCELPEEERSLSDERRSILRYLDEQTTCAINVRDNNRVFYLVDERIRTLEEEGLDSPRNLMRCCHDAFHACRVKPDLEASRRNLEKALEYARGSLSEDERDMKILLKDMANVIFHINLSQTYM